MCGLLDMSEGASNNEQHKDSFLTGTRTDYGKLKPLIQICSDSQPVRCRNSRYRIHLLSEYSGTITHIQKDALAPVYSFIIKDLKIFRMP